MVMRPRLPWPRAFRLPLCATVLALAVLLIWWVWRAAGPHASRDLADLSNRPSSTQSAPKEHEEARPENQSPTWDAGSLDEHTRAQMLEGAVPDPEPILRSPHTAARIGRQVRELEGELVCSKHAEGK